MFAAKCRCTFAHGCDFISRHFRFGIPPSFYSSKVTPLANIRDISIFSEGKTTKEKEDKGNPRIKWKLDLKVS